MHLSTACVGITLRPDSGQNQVWPLPLSSTESSGGDRQQSHVTARGGRQPAKRTDSLNVDDGCRHRKSCGIPVVFLMGCLLGQGHKGGVRAVAATPHHRVLREGGRACHSPGAVCVVRALSRASVTWRKNAPPPCTFRRLLA